MHCPFCSHEDTRVLDSRLAEFGSAVRRRRECVVCKKRFTTYERHEEAPLLIVKKDGRRERFDKHKILEGVLRACEKRPVSYDEVENLAVDVERKLRSNGENEVSALEVGDEVMERLRALDEVAYVRFASVYKEFKDVSRFSDELRALEEHKGGTH